MKKSKLNTVARKAVATLALGLTALTRSGCFATNPFFGGPQSGGTVAGTSGPEPQWVKNSLKKRPTGKHAFIGDGSTSTIRIAPS